MKTLSLRSINSFNHEITNKFFGSSLIAIVVFILAANPAVAQTGLNVSSIDGSNGVSLFGGEVEAGTAIATGDINGDGIDDLFIGDEGSDTDDIHGRVYVVFGHDTASTDLLYSLGDHDENGLFALSDLDGDNGFVVNGIDQGNGVDQVGRALSSGDVNNDGFDDLIIGAPNAQYYPNGNNIQSGRVYVILGAVDVGTSTFGSIELSGLSQSDGYIINGVPDQTGDARTGTSVQGSDFNNDGYDDILIGDTEAEPTSGAQAGGAYMIYGNQLSTADAADGNSDGTIELSNLNGTTGYFMAGIDNDDQTGREVGAGDINNDGNGDLIIGSPRADALADTADNISDGNGGQAYVIFGDQLANLDADDGSADGTVDLEILNSPRGFKINPIDFSDELGEGIATGDINNDGVTDLIIGATDAYDQAADPEQPFVGEIYTIYGSPTIGSSGNLSLTNFNGFTFQGIDDDDVLGRSISVGDVNGDQIDDIVVGALDVSSFTYLGGETYVLFGDNNVVSDGFMTADELNGSNGFAIKGEYYRGNSGTAVGAGDLNNDGIDEVIFGAPDAGLNGDGYSYVFNNARTTALRGSSGFRTLSAPTSGKVFNEMLAPFWTQGITNSDSPGNGDPNVWKWDKNSGSQGDWVPLNDQQTSSLSAGEGYLLYAYSDDNATGQDEGFPKHITTLEYDGEGSLNSGSVNPVSSLADGTFEFIGNPYSRTIDWDNVSTSGLSSTIYAYDHSASSWIMWNGTSGNLSDGYIAPFQGFFVQGNGGNGNVTIAEDDISGATSLEKTRSEKSEDPVIKLNLTYGDHSNSAWIQLSPEAKAGRDKHDGLELEPLKSPNIQLYTESSEGNPLNINAYPATERLQLPIRMMGLNIDDSSSVQPKVSLNMMKSFEENAEIYLMDHHQNSKKELVKGEPVVVDLSEKTTSAIKINAEADSPAQLFPETNNLKSESSRYSVIIESTVTTDVDNENNLPEKIILRQNYPNPFNPVTKIHFDVPKQANVSLTVYNTLGQKVRTLVNERRTAGRYSAVFDANSLSSGIYVYRLQVGSEVLTKKMTLVK